MSSVSRESMAAIINGNYAELACTVTDLIEEGYLQEAIQIIHYGESSFSSEELDKLCDEIKIDTDEDLSKDQHGWYFQGDTGHKTIPHHIAMALLENEEQGM